jgi:GDP-4-dehydro-6-deoxy-D-mannose reductase
VQVHGVSLPSDGTQNLEHARDRIDLRFGDLTDYAYALELLGEIRPDYLFHLAAQASVRRSWENPAATLITNITIQLHLLQAIIELGIAPRILVIGSADEYGAVRPDEIPISENTPLRPLNPYAVSKVTQDFMAYQYFLSHDLHIVRLRPFNHFGPRQRPGFVVPDFAKQIATIEAGLQEPVIRVGNLDAHRDFSDVRDIVRGYYLALAKGHAGQVYNLGSSHSYSIQDVLDKLIAMSRVSVRVEKDPSLVRPADIPMVSCDSSRFQRDTGWEPTYDIDQTLGDVLDEWRLRVGA